MIEARQEKTLGIVEYKPDQHYAMLAGWWTAIKHTPAPAESLPWCGIGFGLIADEAAAGFIYETGTAVALLENLVTNPEVRRRQRIVAIDKVMAALLERAGERGVKWIRSVTFDWPVLHIARRHGYIIHPERCWHMGRVL